MKKIILLSIGFLLLVAGPFACSGGAGGGASPVGGSQNYGAPPISIPGPEALNMDAISVSSDGGGTATVDVGPGAGTSGHEIHVRNLGDVAWYRPLQDFLIQPAYALGESASCLVLANGSCASFTMPAKIGEWLEFRQCMPGKSSVCGAAFRIQTKIGVSPGSGSVFSAPPTKMSVDPSKGGAFYLMNFPRKHWDWTQLFISKAYAEDPVPLPLVLNVPLESIPSSVCTLPEYGTVAASTPKDEGKILTVQTNQFPFPPDTKVFEFNGNRDNYFSGVHAFAVGGHPKLAAYSANKVVVVNVSNILNPVLEWSAAYPSDVMGVEFLNNHLLVILKSEAGKSYPRYYSDKSCISVPRGLEDLQLILGIDNNSMTRGRGGDFAMNVKNGHGYCVFLGTSNADQPIASLKQDYCQDHPLTDVSILSADACAVNYVVLSPVDKRLVYNYVRRESADPASCPALPSDGGAKNAEIPGAVNPVNFSWGVVGAASVPDRILAVLDSPNGNSRLIPFKIELVDGGRFSITPIPDKVQDLGVRAALVRYTNSTEGPGVGFLTYSSDNTIHAPGYIAGTALRASSAGTDR